MSALTRRKPSALLAVLLFLGLAAVTANPASAHILAKCGPASGGNFTLLRADPIVEHGVSPSMHLHQFFGNGAALAALAHPENATYADISGQPGTGCDIAKDTALYWTPTLLVGGQLLDPLRVEAYYRSWDHADTDPALTTQAFPRDARLVVGNMDATSARDVDTRNVFWSCGLNSSKGSTDPNSHFATPAAADCATATGSVYLTMSLNFPSCWDGSLNSHAGTNTADFSGDPMMGVTNHFAYRVNSACPAGFSIHVPTLTVNVAWNYAGDGSNVRLSSGPGYTIHGDFWNTWVQTGLVNAVNTCIDTTNTSHPHGNAAVCGA